MNLNDRSPDLVDAVRSAIATLDDLKRMVISRWGRIPIQATDPPSPPDGSIWIRSDTGDLNYRVNATTVTPRQGRNLLDNGQLEVNQRGVGLATIGGGGTFLADRWQAFNNAVGTATLNSTTKAGFGGGNLPAGRPSPGHIQWVAQTVADPAMAAGDFLICQQGLEGLDVQHLSYGTTGARSVTVSFDVYCSISGTFIVELQNQGSTGPKLCSQAYTTVAGQFTTVTLTFPPETTVPINDDTNGRFTVLFFLAAGSTYTSGTLGTTWHNTTANRAAGLTTVFAATVNAIWAVTNVQAEVAAAATPYDARSYSAELQRCQRYYEATGFVCNVAPIPPHYSGYWKVPKRVSPVLSVTLQGGTGGAVTAFSPGFGETMGFYQSAANTLASNTLVVGSAEI